jgi:hypothetical protein
MTDTNTDTVLSLLRVQADENNIVIGISSKNIQDIKQAPNQSIMICLHNYGINTHIFICLGDTDKDVIVNTEIAKTYTDIDSDKIIH